MKLALMSDDFTGANDLGLQLMKYGIKVSSTFKVDSDNENFEIISSETRNVSEEEAERACRPIYEKLIKKGYNCFYKKIDSTLRGNVKREAEILLEYLPAGEKIAVVLPFPKNGRSVINGKHYVNGVPLHETFFGKDPIKPIQSNELRDYFDGELIGLEVIRSGKLNDVILKTTKPFIIFDGETDADLDLISEALFQTGYDKHIIGSAGIMDSLMNIWGYKKDPILIISGSCNSINIKQVEYFLSEEKVSLLDYDILNDIIIGKVQEDRNILLRSIRDEKEIEENLSKYRAIDIRKMIGSKGIEFIKKYNIKKIISCGGDISVELINRLGIESFDIFNEIEPGIAYGKGGEYEIITKPGGFGSEKIYKKCFSFLKNCR
jgi:uncharacterized protein YgbK (DUF1537 family)